MLYVQKGRNTLTVQSLSLIEQPVNHTEILYKQLAESFDSTILSIIQGVVTSLLSVETLATGINIRSSNLGTFSHCIK